MIFFLYEGIYSKTYYKLYLYKKNKYRNQTLKLENLFSDNWVTCQMKIFLTILSVSFILYHDDMMHKEFNLSTMSHFSCPIKKSELCIVCSKRNKEVMSLKRFFSIPFHFLYFIFYSI